MRIENITFAYKTKKVLDGINLNIKEGEVTSFIGANGSGKTTLLKLLCRSLRPNSGKILLNNKNLNSFTYSQLAKNIAIVHQKKTVPADLTVKALISYGRLPYTSMFKSQNEEDKKMIEWAIDAIGLKDRQNDVLSNLSGGQIQRAFIGMALAQGTKILILDEPTTFLDVKYQYEVLNLIERLNYDYKITIIMVLHDIAQAMNYSDNIIALKNGQIICNGRAKEVINDDIIEKIYDIKLKIIKDEQKFAIVTKN